VSATIATVAQEPKDDLLPVRDHGKWGFIDTSGHIRIPPQFDDAIEINNTFDDDIEPVKKGGRWDTSIVTVRGPSSPLST
jgi:hypothetical protein